jgi:dihydropteroate synthase
MGTSHSGGADAPPSESRGPRAAWWQLGGRRLHLPRRPLLMGILNVTPDSFSDGGKFLEPQSAVERALQLVADGADILDLGGESTRPYAEPVAAQEELDRVMPVLAALVPHVLVPISIDTSKAAVARAAVAAGAEIINDITALQGDPDMLDVARRSHAGLCIMHMRGTPLTMQDNPAYDDVVGEVFDFLRRRRDALVAAGIEQQRIAIDPGIGFGKTHEHNVLLLRHCARLHALGCPVLVGHSRKGFIGKLIENREADTTAGTIGASIALANQGVQILRVHDVAAVRQALVLYAAAGGLGDNDGEPK